MPVGSTRSSIASSPSRRFGTTVVVVAVLLSVALAGVGPAAATSSDSSRADSPEIVSVLESNGTIEIAFDGPVQAADDGGDIGVDDLEVRVRKGGTDNFTVYEDGFTVSSSSTTDARVELTDVPWGDLDPVDTVYVNFTTALENATGTSDNTTVAVDPDASAVERYDSDGDGIDITELAAAAAAFVRGDLTIAELGRVAQDYVSS